LPPSRPALSTLSTTGTSYSVFETQKDHGTQAFYVSSGCGYRTSQRAGTVKSAPDRGKKGCAGAHRSGYRRPYILIGNTHPYFSTHGKRTTLPTKKEEVNDQGA